MIWPADRLLALWTRAQRSSYLGSHVALATGTSLLMGVLGLITGPLVARLLGPDARGTLAAIQAWPMLLTTIAALGLHEATIYFSAREPAHTARYLMSATFLALAASVPVVIAGYLLMPLMLHAQPDATVAAARWYLLVIPLLGLVSVPLGALRGRMDLVTWNGLRLVPPLGWLVLLIIASGSGHRSAEWLARSYPVMMAVACVVVWVVTRSRIPGRFAGEPRDWRPMLKYGLPTMASQAPMLLSLRFDQMLMAALLMPHALGLYAVAVAWSGMLSPMMSGIGIVVFPAVAGARNAGDQADVLARGTRLSVAVSLGLGLVVLGLAPVAIPFLFGAAFAPAVNAALVLVPAAMVSELNGILREGARGLGETQAVLRSELFGLGAGVLALGLLLGPFGIVGAAFASLIGYGAATILLLRSVGRATHRSMFTLVIPQFQDLSLVWAQARAIARG